MYAVCALTDRYYIMKMDPKSQHYISNGKVNIYNIMLS